MTSARWWWWGAAAVLGATAGLGATACQYATGLHDFDPREDDGGGGSTASATLDVSSSVVAGSGTMQASTTTSASTADTSATTGATTVAAGGIVAEDLDRPTEILVHGGMLYYVEQSTLAAAAGRVWRAAANGTTAPEALVEDLVLPTTIAVHESTLYFADDTADVVSAVDLTTLETTVFANSGFGRVRQVAVDDTHVYWIGQSGLLRKPFVGGTSEVVVADAMTPFDVGRPTGFAIVSSDIVSFPKVAGATPDPMTNMGKPGPGHMAAADMHLFVPRGSGVDAIAYAGGIFTISDAEYASHVAVHPHNARRALWTSATLLRTGSLDTTPSDVASGFQQSFGLAVDDIYAYVTDLELGRVSRVPLPPP